MNVARFEGEIAELCDAILAIRAQIYRLSDNTWASSTGADYETVYNSLPNPDDIPVGGAVKKWQMNNAVSGMNSVKAAIDNASAALAILAEFRVEV